MNKEEFISEVRKMGINCGKREMDLLDKYYKFLIMYNSKVNLTRITLEEDVYLKHFYDSLSAYKVMDFNNIGSLCDVGSGAGFPGVVLKIFFPHMSVTLVDSLGKRCLFLEELIYELGLSGINVVNMRGEDYALSNREKFDVVIARAVTSVSGLLEICTPMVKVGGCFVLMRGKDEVRGDERVFSILGCEVEKKVLFSVSGLGERSLYRVCKVKKTDKRYPRRYSEIKKRPL